MPMDSADLVVVGAGTVGAWCAVRARELGAERVVVVDAGLAGYGASTRAAGMVRTQGGTRTAVELACFSVDFYRSQLGRYGIDSGFRTCGYLILATDYSERAAAQERVAMQRAAGLDARWVDADEAARLQPLLDPRSVVGATYADVDGAIDPPRNVTAYVRVLRDLGVELRERTPVTGFKVTGRGDARRCTGVQTPDGDIATERVVLAGGVGQGRLAALLGVRVPVGGARHTVAVTSPHPEVAAHPVMGFDIGAGLYWRQEEGGLLFGASDPRETPGEATAIDLDFLDRARRRLAVLLPVTAGLGLRKAWAATIDYTPDHLPVLGPAVTPEGERVAGVTLASAGGHGMMWGPGVAACAADLALAGTTDVTDVSELGVDRFDAEGRSRLGTDPIALPFPTTAA